MKTSSLLIHPTTYFRHAVLALVALHSAQALTYDWNQTATPLSWSDAANWTTTTPPAGGPSGAGIVVDINTNIAAATTINLFNTGDSGTAAKTVGILNIGDTNSTHAFTLAPGTGSGSLLMDNNGSNAQINQLSTSKGDTISSPIALNGSLDISNAAAANTLTISGGITSNSTGLKTITNGGGGNGKVILSGIIGDGSSGSVAVTQNSSTSILQLGNTNTFTGGLNINKGTVQLASNSGAGNGLVTIGSSGNSAILDLNGGSRLIIQLATAGTAANQIIANSSTTVAATMTYFGATTSNFDGIIQDAVNGGNRTTGVTVNKAGANLTLSGANTYTGLTTITTGTLGGIGSHAFGSTSGISIAGAGILSLRGDNNTSFSKASDSTLYAVTTSSSGSTINVNQATVAGTGQTMTIGTLGTSSTAATYQLNFTGANNTSLSVGAVTGTASTAIATSTISNSISGGGSLTLASFTSANTSGGDTLTFSGAGNTTVTGAITPSSTTLNLKQNGTGVVTLNGTSSYTGTTTVSSGTLVFAKQQALYNSTTGSWTPTNISVASTGVLAVGVGASASGYFDTAALDTFRDSSHMGLSTTTTGLKTGAILGFDTTNATSGTFTYNSNITNFGASTTNGIAKIGTGTLVLGGTNTFTGMTTVTAGTLLINGNSSAATGAISVANTATLGGAGTLGGVTTLAGALSPGNGTTAIGTLNGTGLMLDAGANFKFDLGAGNSSDRIALTGAFTKGTGSSFTFNFNNTGVANSTYTLATFNSLAGGFAAGDVSNFNYTGLSGGVASGTFGLTGTALTFTTVPEPATWALLAFSLTTVMVLRRRRKD